MKTLIATAIASIAIVSGAQAGQVTQDGVAAHFAADQSGNDAAAYFGTGDAGFANDKAEMILSNLAVDSNESNASATVGSEIMSTKGIANQTAASIFAKIAAEEPGNS
jgi:hypothetical protein